MKCFVTVLMTLSGLVLSGQVLAAEECAFKWDIHKEHALFAGSTKPTAAATTAAAAPALSLDTLYAVKLSPADGVKYDVPPGKKMLTDGTFGGSLMFKVPATGTYRVSLDGKFWIDIVGDHQLVATKDFGGPHDCPGGPSKLVEFELKQGAAYLLQISAASTQEVKVSITRSAP
jgi:hypothetical protein